VEVLFIEEIGNENKMSNTIITYSQVDINKLIDNKLIPFKEEMYKQLNKLREKIIDMNDIQQVLNRNTQKEEILKGGLK
jgi:hypothetical protein